ncbi:MAG: DNA mismatch repair endonuclease MutL [Bacteroidales bacterium]|nr:DNA mismatch repair endonuclease MutL [Bacteroidales bacterium]
MGTLHVLPANIANMIAAGEVVQRPASVVKELMENAIDAGATQVNVVVTDAGRTLIRVIDDGCGMSPADAVLCFERHATSKIASAEDLSEVLTYGFRGEALASIASVAEVTLRTRRPGDETATEVRIDGSGSAKTASAAGPVGSSFSVRNLFYNIPARRKFLKSDSVELKHIVEEFTRVALTRPEIAFSLNANGRDLFLLKKAKSLKFRILDLLGTGVVGDIVDLSTETSLARIEGFVGRPDTARKTLGNQYFFVNGRYFRSPYLHKAVMKAYDELIPEGTTPSYFIYLEVDPRAVDVNIHPTKTEVKFEDDNILFQTLYASVKEVLGRNAFGAAIDFETGGQVEIPQLGRNFQEYKETGELSIPVDPAFNPFDQTDAPNIGFDRPEPAPAARPAASSPYVEPREDYGALFENSTLPSTQVLSIKGKYLVTPSASGLMLIHFRRAVERIIYDRCLRALSGSGHVSQKALFPVQVQLGTQTRLLFEEHAELLASLGFDITPFGTDTVVVNGVPEGYSCEEGKVRQAVSDLALILSEDHAALPEMMQSALAARFATLGAINAEAPTTAVEARRFIDTLFASDNPERTAGGKRIIAIVGADEIEKKLL